MTERKRTAITEIKKAIEDIRGTTKGMRGEGREVVGSVRLQPLRGALERRGPFRRFFENRPTPLQDAMKEREKQEKDF